VDAPVPIAPGQHVTLLGYHGAPLHWSTSGGRLTIDVPADAQRTGQYAWVFKVNWS
jgi:alpha-L-fucosidase